MTDDLSLICFDLKLQNVSDLEDNVVSKTDYGRHLIACMEKCFETQILSTWTCANTAAKVWNETLASSDGKVMVTLRLFDRSSQAHKSTFEFGGLFLTVTSV